MKEEIKIQLFFEVFLSNNMKNKINYIKLIDSIFRITIMKTIKNE